MPVTLVFDDRELQLEATPRGESLWLPLEQLAPATGWDLKPEGVCKDDVCVSLSGAERARLTSEAGGAFDLAGFARLLQRPVLHDDEQAVWVVGESDEQRGAELRSLEAPDFTLPDFEGTQHSLSDYRGKKVFLVSWASW